MSNNYLCALDIGSSKIAACLACLRKKRIEKVFFESAPAKGVRAAVVVDSIDLVGAVTKLMKGLRAKSGINIKLIYANISGEDIVTKQSRAIIPLAERGNKVITASDVQKVNEQARILGSGLEEEIIHLIPSSYAIDSKTNLTNPIGLYSHRLEADLYLLCGKLSSIQTLNRVINQSGYELKAVFFSGLATSRAIFNKELQRGINIFCDIGSDITEILLFKEGILQDTKILAVGADYLTAQLQDELKIPAELAEDIKRSYGLVGDAGQIAGNREILVKKSNLYKPIKESLVVEIITSSAKTLCSKIKNALEQKVSLYEVNTVWVCGRAVLLEGFIEALENTLSSPVKLGRITNPHLPVFIKEDSELIGQKYLTYLTSLGILLEAMQDNQVQNLPAEKPQQNLVTKALAKFKEVYQEYF